MSKRFINIPVPMLGGMFTNSQKFFSDAFDVGIYLYSKTLEGDDEKKYNDALNFFEVTQGNIFAGIQNAKRILSGLRSKYPTTGIEIDMLFNFYKFEKTEFEIACFAAFLGIKSIIGKKTYNKTNKIMIHARMFGYSSSKELPEKLTDVQKKYKARWHMDKILLELQKNWNLNILWNHNRGFYLSFDLTLEQLAGIVKKEKKSVWIKNLKERKRRALETAEKTTAS